MLCTNWVLSVVDLTSPHLLRASSKNTTPLLGEFGKILSHQGFPEGASSQARHPTISRVVEGSLSGGSTGPLEDFYQKPLIIRWDAGR